MGSATSVLDAPSNQFTSGLRTESSKKPREATVEEKTQVFRKFKKVRALHGVPYGSGVTLSHWRSRASACRHTPNRSERLMRARTVAPTLAEPRRALTAKRTARAASRAWRRAGGGTRGLVAARRSRGGDSMAGVDARGGLFARAQAYESKRSLMDDDELALHLENELKVHAALSEIVIDDEAAAPAAPAPVAEAPAAAPEEAADPAAAAEAAAFEAKRERCRKLVRKMARQAGHHFIVGTDGSKGAHLAFLGAMALRKARRSWNVVSRHVSCPLRDGAPQGNSMTQLVGAAQGNMRVRRRTMSNEVE